MNILFAGTPEFAVPSLHALAERFKVVAVLTAPDRRKGRGRGTTPSPIAAVADSLGFPVLKPERLGSEARIEVTSHRPDLLVVVAYGRIFGPKFLSLFHMGGINLHPSLLPRYRGPAPIPAIILAGDSMTGVTVQRLALEMDAGAIIDQSSFVLSGEETTESLTEFCARLGADRLVEVVERIESGVVQEMEQNHAEATYCGLIERSDGKIDWRLPAVTIERMVRAYTPWPTAFTTFEGRQLSILSASMRSEGSGSSTPGRVVGVDKSAGILVQTGSGTLIVEHLQLQSKKPLRFLDFLNGTPEFIGAVLGAAA